MHYVPHKKDTGVKGKISRRGRGSGGVEIQEKAMGVNMIHIYNVHNYENIITRSDTVWFKKKLVSKIWAKHQFSDSDPLSFPSPRILNFSIIRVQNIQMANSCLEIALNSVKQSKTRIEISYPIKHISCLDNLCTICLKNNSLTS